MLFWTQHFAVLDSTFWLDSTLKIDPEVLRSALVEFHQHAGELDIFGTRIRVSIPYGVAVNSKFWPWAPVIPPGSFSLCARTSWVLVVVLVGSAELHSVGDCVSSKWCGKCIASVSAVSRHLEAVLGSLRFHRKWWIFGRIPQPGVFSDLKTRPVYYTLSDFLSQTT